MTLTFRNRLDHFMLERICWNVDFLPHHYIPNVCYLTPTAPIYGCQFWNIAYRYNYDRLRVAFNDAFRLLLDVPRRTSASSLFVRHRVPTFAAAIRKFTYKLYDCIRNSSNSLSIAYVESDLFYHSKLLHKWRKLLYTCMDYSRIVLVFIVYFYHFVSL